MSAFTNKYSYRRGFAYKVSAQVVGETLERIGENGSITSGALLDVSRPPDAPTHGLFEWNDSIAAEKYRLQQATTVINSIEVEIAVNGENKKYTAFLNTNAKSIGVKADFSPIRIVMENEDQTGIVLANALAELTAFERKYKALKELSGVFQAINKVKKSA